MKELISVKVYVVIFDNLKYWGIERIYQEEIDAISYCMGKDFCYYEERELE